MQSLQINPALPYLLPADQPIGVALVGCGGTGSHIAQSLARIAAHVQASGLPSLKLCFIDGDTVEAKNVGRQLFSPAEIGRNKAQTLAARFSAALGQSITAIPEMATEQLLMSSIGGGTARLGILVGAVDSAEGRKVLANVLGNGTGPWSIWLDCGNHESSGQVCVGSTTSETRLRSAFSLPGLCGALPAPSVQFPELLTVAKKVARDDCAALQEDNVQSLMVNQMMAAIAGEYLYNLIVRRRLTTFSTTVDLASLSMRTSPITARAIVEACPILKPRVTPKRKQKAA